MIRCKGRELSGRDRFDSAEWAGWQKAGSAKSGQPHAAVQTLARHEEELSALLGVTYLGIF